MNAKLKLPRPLSIKKDHVALISLASAAILALYLNLLSFWLCVAAVPALVTS